MTARRPDPRNGQIKYIKLWVRDLLADTSHLSPIALASYVRLFMHTVLAQAPLPDKPGALSRVTGLTVGKWKTARAELLDAGVIESIDGCLHDRRAQKAIDEFREASGRNRSNVGKRYQVIDGLKDAQA